MKLALTILITLALGTVSCATKGGLYRSAICVKKYPEFCQVISPKPTTLNDCKRKTWVKETLGGRYLAPDGYSGDFIYSCLLEER